jgi:hypothetical protein
VRADSINVPTATTLPVSAGVTAVLRALIAGPMTFRFLSAHGVGTLRH